MAPSGEPRESTKPQPIGNYPLVVLFTLCTLCALFIIWRRANTLKTVVAHQLKTWTSNEGRIRLSEDDGPPAHSFVGEDDDDDDEDVEPLAVRIERLRNERARQGTGAAAVPSPPPPPPPPKDITSTSSTVQDPLSA